VNAGYASLSHNFEKFSFNIGLRAEQANLLADLLSKNYAFTKRFITLHPSLSMSYKLSDVQIVRFAYSNRINRPGMEQLNPYINDLDSLNIRYGNINLDPSRGHSFELGFNRFTSLGSISSSVFYRRTNNMINSYTLPVTDNTTSVKRAIYYTTYANLGENISWGMDVNGNIMMLAGKLNLGMGGTLIHNSFVNELNADYNRDQYSFNANFDARLNLASNWNIGTNLRYTGPQAFSQGRIEGFVTGNMDIRKSFMNRKFNITLSADDLLNTRNAARIINTSFTQNSLNKTTTRVIRLGVNYRFGGFTAGGGTGGGKRG
jgi:outer membrane cobalamin receptor